MATVAEVWRYPVKSMAGERLDSCQVAPTGLEGDRRWALVDGSPNRAGKPLTIREEDRLMTYRARLAGGVVEVMSPGGEVGGVDDRLVSRLAAQAKRPLSLARAGGWELRRLARPGRQPGDRRRFRRRGGDGGRPPALPGEPLRRRPRAGGGAGLDRPPRHGRLRRSSRW